MANPLADPSLAKNVGYASTVANILGLNNWQLEPGSYNGVKFHLVVSGILGNLNRFNPAAGAISQVSGLLSKAGLIGNLLPPTNDNLPYGTSTISKNITDSGSRKFARHRLPNSNQNVLEDLGWDGEQIRVIGIMFGSSSLEANNNLFNVMINPSIVSIQNRNVLVHPVLGTIRNVLLTSYKRIHSSEYYKAISYEFVFETSAPVLSVSTPNLSTLATVFNTAVSVYNAINSSVALASSLFTAGKNIITSQFQQNYSNSKINAATLIGASKLMYNNLKPVSFVNPSLEGINISTVNLTVGSTATPLYPSSVSSSQQSQLPLTGFVNVDLSSYNTVFNTGLINGVTQVISLYATSVQNTINTIQNSGQQSSFQAVISNLEAGVVALNNVGQSLLQNFLNSTTTVVTTETISLEEIFFKYNIDFNNASNIQTVISLNPGTFTSLNVIPPGVQVILPNDISS